MGETFPERVQKLAKEYQTGEMEKAVRDRQERFAPKGTGREGGYTPSEPTSPSEYTTKTDEQIAEERRDAALRLAKGEPALPVYTPEGPHISDTAFLTPEQHRERQQQAAMQARAEGEASVFARDEKQPEQKSWLRRFLGL